MRKAFVFVSAIVLVLVGTASVLSATQVTLLDQVFVRDTGTPTAVSQTFPALNGQVVVNLTNGSAPDAKKGEVSSATITVNGITVFGPSDFNQNVNSLAKTVAANAGQNILTVELKSKPGSQVRIQIVQQLNAAAGGVIGTQGGTIEGNDPQNPLSVVRAVIPPGALTEPTIVTISSVPVASLNLDPDIAASITAFGAIRFDVGTVVLSQSAELGITTPAGLSDTSNVFLGKILPLTPNNLLMKVDVTAINQDMLMSSPPDLGGTVSSGTFLLYKDVTACGAPDRPIIFSGLDATCRTKIAFEVYARAVAPTHYMYRDLLSKEIEHSLAVNDAIQDGVAFAENLDTLNGLGGQSASKLTALGTSSMTSFTTTLLGDQGLQIGEIWVSLATSCVGEIGADPVNCVKAGAATLVSAMSNLYATIQVTQLTKSINDSTIADLYLTQYYRWGGNTTMLPTNYGLPQGASIQDVVSKIAETIGSYDLNQVLSIIQQSQKWVDNIMAVAYSTQAYTFTIREFSITLNGSTIFDDTFNNGDPPPSAASFPTWYWTWGAMGPENSHSPGGLKLDSSGAVSAKDVTGQQSLIFQLAELNAYLYNNGTFSVRGTFDLVEPAAYHQGYGIRLNDGTPTHGSDDVVYLGTGQDSSGNKSIYFQHLDFVAGTSTIVDQVPLDPDHEQIAFILTRGNVNSNKVTGSFAYIDDGVWGPTTTFGNTTSIFSSENFTRAEFEAISSYTGPNLVNPTIAQNWTSGPAGTTFYQWGTGFTPNSTAVLHFKKPDGSEYPTANQPIDANGEFWISYPAPTDKPAGVYSWWAVDASGKDSNTVNYTITVNPKIAQSPMSGPPGTIFDDWGTNFTPYGTTTLHFRKPDGSEYPTERLNLDSGGNFEKFYPASLDKPLGNYTWWAIDDATGKKSNEVTYTID